PSRALVLANVAEQEQESDMKQSQTGTARPFHRRRFLKGGMLAAGSASAVPGLSITSVFAAGRQHDDDHKIPKGDIAILRFLAAAEPLETDLWQQCPGLAGGTGRG